MKPAFNPRARKRPVNLTLNEDLVNQAKSLTDNLSAVVENLLSGFLEAQEREQQAKAQVVEASVRQWNDFEHKIGALGDEYSTL